MYSDGLNTQLYCIQLNKTMLSVKGINKSGQWPQVWFTSDTHFGHKNIIKYSNRPYKDVSEMNEKMVDLWNKTVNPEDLVFHLGDIAMGQRALAPAIIDRLNGHIVLVPGNHDHPNTIGYMTLLSGEQAYSLREIRVDKQRIVLCHYAMRIWHKSHHGSWHLYGHSHASLEDKPWGKSMDVGVDAANLLGFGLRPISFEEISHIMKQREITIIDHHNSNTNE
jgi:calcineurin-like phosphoesterase family protein